MVVYTWWCWHIYKGDGVGVDVDQLGEETPPAECPPIECGQSDGATDALYRKVRISQSDRTLGHFVTGCWMSASGPAGVAVHRGDCV